MKKLYYSLLALFLSFGTTSLFAQTQTWAWAYHAGDHGVEYASGLAVDNVGDAYITGSYTSAFINFGTYSLLNAGTGTADIFLVKFNAAGGVLWAKTIGGIDGDAGYSVTTDASNNVIMTGWFTSASITFGSTVLNNAGTSSSDMFIAKYDAAGNLLWAKSAGGTVNDRAQAVSTDANSNIYVVGWYSSPSINFGTGALTNSGSATNEIFVVKYDANGTAQYSKSVGGTNYDAAYGCKADAAGNLYVTGSFASASIDFGSGALTNTQTNFHDIFINKYDANGNSVWSRSAAGLYDDIGYAITLAGANLYLTGYFSSTTVQFGTNPVLTNANATTPDIFIASYTTGGTANWSKRAGGTDTDEGRCVYADASGNAYISGSFISPSITFGTGTLTNYSAGTKDLFVAAFSSTGTSLWSLEVGNNADEIGYAIGGTPSASAIYLAGMFNSGTVSFGTNAIFKGCGDDVFYAKLDVTTGLFEYTNDNDLVIYPNPSNGIFTISSSEKIESIEVFNAIGEKVLEQPINHLTNSPINLSSHAKGVYFVRIIADGKMYSQKIVVE